MIDLEQLPSWGGGAIAPSAPLHLAMYKNDSPSPHPESVLNINIDLKQGILAIRVLMAH